MAEEGIMPLWVGGEASGPVKNYIGKRTARFVVGTSAAGWTKFDCDYLCDGTADDVEINAAIQALPSTGGEIVILDGTYNITANINVNKSNVTLTGNGQATVLKRKSNDVDKVINITSTSSTIQNLTINGNKSGYIYSSFGIYLATNSNTIVGNILNNNDVGIYQSGSSNNTIIDNKCGENNNGIYLVNVSRSVIADNICYSNIYGIYIYGSNSNTITGNVCNNNSTDGICLSNIGSSNENNAIVGNICRSNNIGIYLFGSNNTVTGNTCNNNTGCGICLDSSSNNIITGNTCIRGTGLTTDYTSSQYTIRLGGTSNSYNLIAYNNIKGKNYVSDGGTGNTFTGNKYQ